MLGADITNASYRALFNAQSVAGFAAFAIYTRGLPDRTLYQVKGSGALALRTLQICGLLWAVWTAREAGIAELLGVKPILQMLAGHRSTLPEAQGPDMRERLDVRGPFLACRHPLNFAPVPVFWAAPRMTVNRLVFNVLGTAYLVLGSVHEENRLKARYGSAYERYIDSGVPFFVPDLWRLRIEPVVLRCESKKR
jgi:protein-S-isoprenylcysteine O-methyltransferase Ste14